MSFVMFQLSFIIAHAHLYQCCCLHLEHVFESYRPENRCRYLTVCIAMFFTGLINIVHHLLRTTRFLLHYNAWVKNPGSGDNDIFQIEVKRLVGYV